MGIEKRGFASMDTARLKELSGHGGRKAHAMGRAHKWTREEARQAGLRSVAARRRRKAEAEAALEPAKQQDAAVAQPEAVPAEPAAPQESAA
jgi:uncharacterized protein